MRKKSRYENAESREQFLYNDARNNSIKLFYQAGDIARFSGKFFREVFRRPYEGKEIFRQSFETGNRSLPLIAFISFVVGLVLTIQSHPTLEEFGATSWLPAIVSVSLVREIAPVITAIICATTISSKIGAELGAMKETEQIDAMEVSGTNPFRFLVVTRVVSTTLTVPLLVVFADLVSLYACYLGVNVRNTEPITIRLFIHQVFNELQYSDVIPSLIKSVLFGFAVGMIGSYKGYYPGKGAEGVGKSVNAAVVICIFTIFILDLIVTQITDILNFT